MRVLWFPVSPFSTQMSHGPAPPLSFALSPCTGAGWVIRCTPDHALRWFLTFFVSHVLYIRSKAADENREIFSIRMSLPQHIYTNPFLTTGYHFTISPSLILAHIYAWGLGAIWWHYTVRCVLSGLVPSHILLVHCADWGLTKDELHEGWGPELLQVIRYGLPVRGLYPRPYCLSLVHYTCRLCWIMIMPSLPLP